MRRRWRERWINGNSREHEERVINKVEVNVKVK
jgi:hypothetical protein